MASYVRDLSALNVLRGYLREPERVPQDKFEPEQETHLAYRDTVVADMVRAMRLLSRRQYRAEQRTAASRMQEANEAATRARTATKTSP
jgi:hypothetical protein